MRTVLLIIYNLNVIIAKKKDDGCPSARQRGGRTPDNKLHWPCLRVHRVNRVGSNARRRRCAFLPLRSEQRNEQERGAGAVCKVLVRARVCVAHSVTLHLLSLQFVVFPSIRDRTLQGPPRVVCEGVTEADGLIQVGCTRALCISYCSSRCTAVALSRSCNAAFYLYLHQAYYFSLYYNSNLSPNYIVKV